MRSDLYSELTQHLGVDVDPNLLALAFTHRSFAYESGAKETNERLEFLGDAVIENIIVSYLYRRYPDQREGFLSTMKVNFVNRITLGHLAKVIGLHEYLVIGRTLDDLQNAREEDKILCDIFEAFIAAIYLDFNNDKHGFLSSFISGAGYQVAELFLINLLLFIKLLRFEGFIVLVKIFN